MLYELFRWIHILSYLTWLCVLAGSLFYGIRIHLANDRSTIYNLIKVERLITKWGVILGAGGIIISGWLLSVIPQGPQWGWFDIQLYPWLAFKQLLFAVILILIAIDIRLSKKLAKWLQANKMGEKSGAVKKWGAAFRLSLAVYVLVIISTLLGWYKPGLTSIG